MLYTFADGGNGQVRLSTLIQRVQAKDINPEELVVGGAVAASGDGANLESLGAAVFSGVMAAAREVGRRIQEDLGIATARG